MPFLGLRLLFTVAFVEHVLNTLQERFLVWNLIIAPGIGCLAYGIVVILPELMGSRTVAKAGEAIRDKLDPERALREAQQNLELADTAQNRVRLADAYMARDNPREAAQLYEEALNGVFADDPAIIFKLGQARLELNDPHAALALFDQAREGRRSGLTPPQELLVARATADTGDVTAALDFLKPLVPRFAGEEARCFYAKTLAQAGQLAAARDIVREILQREARAPAHLKRDQKQWYDWARAQNY